eukprot:3121633-Rhodomonas_salina.1
MPSLHHSWREKGLRFLFSPHLSSSASLAPSTLSPALWLTALCLSQVPTVSTAGLYLSPLPPLLAHTLLTSLLSLLLFSCKPFLSCTAALSSPPSSVALPSSLCSPSLVHSFSLH